MSTSSPRAEKLAFPTEESVFTYSSNLKGKTDMSFRPNFLVAKSVFTKDFTEFGFHGTLLESFIISHNNFLFLDVAIS